MSIANEIQRLQSAKADIKSAIEQKGVTVGDGTIDTYAEKIGEISGGSGIELERGLKTAAFTNLNIFGKKEVELNFDNITSLSNLFYINALENQNTIVEKLIINCPNQITSIMNMFYCNGTNWQDRTLKHITFNFDTQKCTAFSNAFNGAIALEIIDGQPLDCSSVTNASYFNPFVNTPKLIDCRFVSNSIKVNLNMSKSPDLSTDTIQSIFDGLATVDTAQTLTLNNNLKILQSQVDSANAKGWTVAGGKVVSEEEYYA